MKVIVDTQSGSSFSIGVDYWDTVLAIKQKIEKSKGIPVFKQTLFFQGNVLQDHLYTFVCQFLHNSRLFLFISADDNTNQNNNDQVPQTEQYPSAPSNPFHEFVNNQDCPVMSNNDQVLETEESPMALMNEFFGIQDSPDGKNNQGKMESVELALKNSQRNEKTLTGGAQNGDDFSVDDLLDFPNEDDGVFVEDETELKVQRKRGVSDENTLHRSNDFSTVPMDDLAAPTKKPVWLTGNRRNPVPPVNEDSFRNAGQTQTQTQTWRCSHCGVQKTPQWRVGPSGAKTLCNACGLRYKSGRL